MCFRNLSLRPTQPGPFTGTQTLTTGSKPRVKTPEIVSRHIHALFWTSLKVLSLWKRSWLRRPWREVSETHADFYSSSFVPKVWRVSKKIESQPSLSANSDLFCYFHSKIADVHQRPPWAIGNLGRQVASKLGTHWPSVAVRAGHIGFTPFLGKKIIYR